MVSALDLSMPVGDALKQGLVMRVSPKVLCGASSPESRTQCRFDPDHECAHMGIDGIAQVWWDR